MIRVNGQGGEDYYAVVVCGCGNQLSIPVVRGWGIQNLEQLAFKCLECGSVFRKENGWKEFPKIVSEVYIPIEQEKKQGE